MGVHANACDLSAAGGRVDMRICRLCVCVCARWPVVDSGGFHHIWLH